MNELEAKCYLTKQGGANNSDHDCIYIACHIFTFFFISERLPLGGLRILKCINYIYYYWKTILQSQEFEQSQRDFLNIVVLVYQQRFAWALKIYSNILKIIFVILVTVFSVRIRFWKMFMEVKFSQRGVFYKIETKSS